jgi:transposase
MRAYSTDLNERLVRAVADGQPMREAARRCGVCVKTVKRAVVQERETGSLERKPRSANPFPAIHGAWDPSRRRHCARHCARGWRPLLRPPYWSTVPGGRSNMVSSPSEATLWRAIRRLGWTQNKRHWQPASATRRRVPPGANLDPEQLVFGDESGATSSLTRGYGWAPHDRRATRSVPRTHGKQTTLVAALAPDGWHEPWMSEGAMDPATFAWSISEQLAPTRRPGQVVVVDQLRVHKAASSRHALEARHCQLLFLPPSSPDFTPIEQAFSKSKAVLRRIGARTKEALWEAMRVAVEAITQQDAAAWFAHTGYALPAQPT